MNSFIQRLLIFIFPFFPFWAWLLSFLTEKSFELFCTLLFLPFSIYFLVNQKKALPTYLIFFILFTVFHISSAFINNATPANVNWIYFILSDVNVLACILLVILENTEFEGIFIKRLNKYIFCIAIVSLICSLIQVKDPAFFFRISGDPEWGLGYIEESRNYSIYSWINYHSLGISFPILISILLSQYIIDAKSNYKLITVLIIGFIVCFLSRYRFAIISALIVSSQLMFIKFRNKLSLFTIAIVSIVAIAYVAEMAGFEIEDVVNNRILEKGSDMGSAKARILSYDVFLLKFPENPLLGVGPATRQDVVDLLGGETPIIHIGYLSYLYYYGVFGISLLLISLFLLLKRAWLVGRLTTFWGSFFGLISFCLANVSFVYFNFSEMGIILSVIYLRYYNCKTSLPMERKHQCI